jgi:hypothetical protein
MAYGKIIPDLMIQGKPAPYAVVNERVIRGAAGLMFALGLGTFMYVFLTKDFTPVKILVPIFWLDFFLKSVFSPSASIFSWLAERVVHHLEPEYVGAIQKRFAWTLGLAMASVMMVVVFVLQLRGMVPFAICLTCLSLMFFESAFGICVGCRMYTWLTKKGWIKAPEIAPACPGGACSINKK